MPNNGTALTNPFLDRRHPIAHSTQAFVEMDSRADARKDESTPAFAIVI